VILRTNHVGELGEGDRHSPADIFPILTCGSEFLGSRAFPAIGLSHPDREDPGLREGEDQITRCDFAHRFIEGVAGAIGIALGRPKIPASDFVAVCLVLVDPPIAHGHRVAGSASVRDSGRQFSRHVLLRLLASVLIRTPGPRLRDGADRGFARRWEFLPPLRA
jgi:hypothetical protein